MFDDIAILPETLALHSVSSPRLVDETGIAWILQVRRQNGQFAALKIYKKPTMGNESEGFSFLTALGGRAAAHVYGVTERSALIEWLDGPSLGDLTRSGRDEAAAAELVNVANDIHSVPVRHTGNLPNLVDWFDALFPVEITPECPEVAHKNMMRCQSLARQLLGNQADVRPLHGDLHHDNIRLGTRGYCAFDAKGVFGDRTYELANAFRNPKGASDVVGDPARFHYLADLWSDRFKVDRVRLMQWAAVKSALSIVWRGSGVVSTDSEFDMLDVFVSALDA